MRKLMGTTYSNTAIFSKKIDAITKHLASSACPKCSGPDKWLYLSDSAEGYTLLFAPIEDIEFNYLLAESVSKALNVPAIYSCVYDSDSLELRFLDKGEELYSFQIEHGEHCEKGDRKRLEPRFTCNLGFLDELDSLSKNYTFAETLHTGILERASLPLSLGNNSFREIEELDEAGELGGDSDTSLSYRKLYFQGSVSKTPASEPETSDTPWYSGSRAVRNPSSEIRAGIKIADSPVSFGKLAKYSILSSASKIIGKNASLSLIQTAAKWDSNKVYPNLLLANEHFKLQNYDIAKQHAEHALKAKPTCGAALHQLAEIYRAQDQLENAHTVLEQSDSASFFLDDLRFVCSLTRGEVNFLLRHYAHAKDILEATLKLPRPILSRPNKLWRAYHFLALSYSRLGDLASAEVYFEEAISQLPSVWVSYKELAVIFLTAGKHELAEKALRRYSGTLTEQQSEAHAKLLEKALAKAAA